MVRWAFHELGEVPSTQIVAKDLAAGGAPEGTVVVAKSQTSGAGRHGRTWVSPPGGLYMSFVLRPNALARPEIMTLVSSTAVVEAINHTTGLSSGIRWPNDVMVNGRKVAGVIAEAQVDRQEVAQVIVGVGVNCTAPIPGELANEATSLFMEAGKTVVVAEVKDAILDSFSRLYLRWQGGEDLLQIWTAHVKTIGKKVLVKLKTDETAFSSLATRLDGEGGLVVESSGKTIVVRAEDVEWLREQG